MIYQVQFTTDFQRDLKRLDKATQKQVLKWIEKRLTNCENPRAFGKGLVGNLSGKWRYRIGDYRMICEIKDNQCMIIAIEIKHRREVYK